MKTKTWKINKLEKVCEILDNKRVPISQKDRIRGIYPYYGASGIVDYIDRYIFDEELVLIGEDGAKWGAFENSAFIASRKYWVNNHAHILKPNNETLINKFLVYFLNYSNLEKYITGATVKKLNQQKLKQIEIPLPPLQEQERIVGILDESFAKIDESIKILEQDLLNLDELMQSALQKAFNPLKDNAKENYKLPQGWEWKSLGDICEIIGGGTPSKQIKQYWENGTIKWATVRDMNTETIEDTEFRITNLGLDNSSTNIINQDFILIATRVGLGKVCLVKDTLAINQDLKGILPHKSLNKKYLFYFFKKNKDFLIENGIGATVKGVSVDFIKSLQTPLPPLKEQEQITSYLDELSSHVKNLKQNYQMQIKNLQELKKSLLDRAFKGRL
ncbi:type I restriction/modification system, S subunit [Campylobacter sp. RM16704]|uniref:type I restriction/modification system, S subunit n=1 Tax=Campylobacter sp. RM16704 TaxID=1500960 RepID=UPI00057FA147|nr:type I restriction/modification system, S subunit [Campylobacter sp. RM16704]AJC85864.1 type I restriction/modification system, S subunit [Campylobacter sp. RM16704]